MSSFTGWGESLLAFSRIDDNNLPTKSSREQEMVEISVQNCYDDFRAIAEALDDEVPRLDRSKHLAFLTKGIQHLSETYSCLDASRPWLCYWILHSMELLDMEIPEEYSNRVAGFLEKCQCDSGGFAGGPGQIAHLAPTYAAVNALCILGTETAYRVINRKKLQEFLIRLHQPDGSFLMHEGGEVDIRATYCAASAAQLTNVRTNEMFENTPQWIASCQSYEGGFAGVPDMEAHGGYSFCGLAALVLLGHERLCDIQQLLRWLSRRQMSYEGGFQGRTNKLVDGCYSFWQGGAFPLMQLILSMEGDESLSVDSWMFHQESLQKYILICCQHEHGGLIDKPGKARDYYHTCYTLSGLSVAQHFNEGKLRKKNIVGHEDNELKLSHPVYNIGVDAVSNANQYFSTLPIPSVNVNTKSQ